jgi:hydroxymethylbilane synthase
MNAPLRAGTRGSALARWQTDTVAQALTRAHPVLAVEPAVYTTRGDVDLSDRLVGKLDKGFFTLELEEALRKREVDLVVHSLKDLPTVMPEGLILGAILPRGPVEDLLIVRPESWGGGFRPPPATPLAGVPLALGAGARVGSSALRREALLRRYAPQAQALPLRGNVPTRLQKLRDGAYDAIVLAAAGVELLGLDLSGLVVLRLDPSRWVPAPGQGAIAVQCRAEDSGLLERLSAIDCPATREAVGLERALLRATEGGCNSPFGALAREGRVRWGLPRETPDGTTRWTLAEAPAEALIDPAAALNDPRYLLGDDDVHDLPIG